MGCNGPRLAFGLLGQDDCPEDDTPIVDMLGVASGDELCTATMAGQEAVHRLNARIAETLLLSEANEIPLLQNCCRVRGAFSTQPPLKDVWSPRFVRDSVRSIRASIQARTPGHVLLAP